MMRVVLYLGVTLVSLVSMLTGTIGAAAGTGNNKAVAVQTEGATLPSIRSKHTVPNAAFIRGGSLWAKIAGKERQLVPGGTGAAAVRYPRWSPDGQWIAYTRGEMGSQQLRLIEISKGAEHQVVKPVDRFAWSPDKNRLAYLQNGVLFVVDAKSPSKPTQIAREMSNFAWLPDGSGMLASTQAKILDGQSNWTQVRLLRIPISATGSVGPATILYTLPQQSDDFFAVGTSTFKWSANGKWFAFLATPTASLSADGNTLCLLSADGKVFRKVDEMVNHEQWIQWSPIGESLAYIGGVGREATSNKQLKVLKAPTSQPAAYTPQGKVAGDFSWNGGQSIIVSQTVESPFSNDPAKRMRPSLVAVDVASGKQRPLTAGAAAVGEYDPIVLPGQQLSWVRYDGLKANVWVAGKAGKPGAVWISGIDPGDNYYEQWGWDAVLDYAG
ncbi:PD40 domain-containing protein [Paenibacillus sp. MMS18-CY102]|uniref:PD40 domain-containing protein n=1 Tax=Paenibacillus sp. MMS18-CY102 TaxID=2682849 RepID=UPI00136664F2|nr:PD40 domain-containing protein [Paenibacillus sp. MMS18-CY102]MWC29433.1 hypothetical protein [Paenibacillus sp. MMS18-CY102]